MLWWMRSDERLSRRASTIISEGRNDLLWSLASSWEIAIKISIGKLELGRPLHRFFAELVSDQNMTILEVGHNHCTRVASLPPHHRDPFDRMLVAQAQVEKVPILTADPKLALYEIDTIS